MKIFDKVIGILIFLGFMSLTAIVCYLVCKVIPESNKQTNVYEQERHARDDAEEAVFQRYRELSIISRCHLTTTGNVTCNLYLGNYYWVSAVCSPRINNTLLVDATRCRFNNAQ